VYLKLFNHNFDLWDGWNRRALINRMGGITTMSIYFIKPLINQRDSQITMRSWDCKRVGESFNDINVDKNPSKPPFLPEKTMVIHSDYLLNFPRRLVRASRV